MKKEEPSPRYTGTSLRKIKVIDISEIRQQMYRVYVGTYTWTRWNVIWNIEGLRLKKEIEIYEGQLRTYVRRNDCYNLEICK